ncbi:putative ribonuclease H-like domain-containing protein [Tanacetum coccineum]
MSKKLELAYEDVEWCWRPVGMGDKVGLGQLCGQGRVGCCPGGLVTYRCIITLMKIAGCYIGDVHSGVVYERKTHEDLHTCLFACFLSQEEPKKGNKKDERVARIEVIRLFLAYASFKDFIVYQMDVKSAFLYDKIEEEVYVCQPLGFEDPEFPNRVYKVENAFLWFYIQHPSAYALTVNPTIYTSCIKQFWATAKAKTVNGEVQIQAIVDGKKVIVTETSVRRALQLKDAEGTECLPNATIFAELERIGLKLNELMGLCTNLSQRVLDLENTKTSQAAEIAKLKEKEDASKQGRKIVDLDADTEAKDKGKGKMVEPEKPLKKKDQILVDEEIAQRLQEELQAELEKEERLERQKEEEDNLISWDNTQAMMEADYETLTRRLGKTLWKLVKAKTRNTKVKGHEFENECYGVILKFLKVMFEPDIESEVWRNLQGYNVTVWKLFSSSGVHFVRLCIPLTGPASGFEELGDRLWEERYRTRDDSDVFERYSQLCARNSDSQMGLSAHVPESSKRTRRRTTTRGSAYVSHTGGSSGGTQESSLAS